MEQYVNYEQTPRVTRPSGGRGSKGLVTLLVVVVVLFIASSGAAYYFWRQSQRAPSVEGQVTDTKAQTQELIDQVGKLIELPSGEVPTVATVTDPEKLKDQAFFVKAKKGDKVLIYATAKKAILYDPEANRIVEVAPINLNNQGSTQGVSTTTLQNTGN